MYLSSQIRQVMIFLVALILFKEISTQNSLQTSCNNGTLKYTIAANLTNHLNLLSKNKSWVENKTIYDSPEYLVGEKAGVVKGTALYIMLKKEDSLELFNVYNSYEEAEKALHNHEIEFFICHKDIVGELIQMNSENLTYLDLQNEEEEDYKGGIVVLNNNTHLKSGLENLTKSDYMKYYITNLNAWMGVDEGLKYINKNIPYPKQNLTVLVNFNQRPYAYKENGEQKGIIPMFLYYFGRYYNYSIHIKEAMDDEDLTYAVKNGTVNASIGYIINDDLINEDNLYCIDFPMNVSRVAIIRYDNSINSTEWEIPNSVSDFSTGKLGALTEQEGKLKELFPKASVVKTSHIPNDLFNELLKENIDGILIDENIVEYYKKHNSRITSYPDKLANNVYGFSFNNETLRNEFNNYISSNYNSTTLNQLYSEWLNAASSKVISSNYKNLTGTRGNIEVTFPNIRPNCYTENGEYKGYELELLYRFAKANNYTISIIPWTKSFTGKYNVNIGCQNISSTKDRYFSNPILTTNSVLAVRKDSVRSDLPIEVLNKNYTPVHGNWIEIPVEVSGINRTSTCYVPNKYSSDIIYMNCSIPGFNQTHQFKGDYKYYKTNKKLRVLYSTIDADNLLNSNSIFPNSNSITHSNLDVICPPYNNDNGTNITIIHHRKKKSGLSTGGIIGITIPCCVAVVAALGFAFVSRKNVANQPPINTMNNVVSHPTVNDGSLQGLHVTNQNPVVK